MGYLVPMLCVGTRGLDALPPCTMDLPIGGPWFLMPPASFYPILGRVPFTNLKQPCKLPVTEFAQFG